MQTIRNDLNTVTPGCLYVLGPGLAGVWTTLVPLALWRLWFFCCLEDGDLFGVKLCCSLPVRALSACVGGERLFATWLCLTAPQVAEAPAQEWCGVSSPSIVPPHTEVLWHQLNTTTALKAQDLSVWMQTEKELIESGGF